MMNNRSPRISYLELQSLYHKISLLPNNGLLQPQFGGEGEGDHNHLGFADFEKLDCSKTPLHSQNADFPEKIKGGNSESRDTLLSLVQSCSCRESRSHENSIRSHGEGIQECKLHQPQERFRNLLMTYQKNVGNEKYYYSKPQLEKIDSASEKESKKQKKRIRWTEDLHKKFMECVDRLGGSKKATPKGIVKLMKCDGLTIFHVKSHLQKYRGTEPMPQEKEGNSDHDQLGLRTGMQIAEALRLQIDVQQCLCHQLESQKKLQKRIEEQSKLLQTMLECQQKLNK